VESSQDKEDNGHLMYHSRVFSVFEGDVFFPNGRKSRQIIDVKTALGICLATAWLKQQELYPEG
jgi:hypothetical protein